MPKASHEEARFSRLARAQTCGKIWLAPLSMVWQMSLRNSAAKVVSLITTLASRAKNKLKGSILDLSLIHI